MCQIDNEELNNAYKEVNKLDMPYFFHFAKDKDFEVLEDKNDSFVNQICTRIENVEADIQKKANERKGSEKNVKQLYDFSLLKRFDYRKLMNNKNIELDEDFIELYNELNEDKNIEYLKTKSKDEEMYYSICLDYKKKIFDYCANKKLNIVDAADMIVKYAYTQKQKQRKTLLWEVFGIYIISNLKRNLKNRVVPEGYFRCLSCNGLHKKKDEIQVMCNRCSNSTQKEFNKIKDDLDKKDKIKKILKFKK